MGVVCVCVYVITPTPWMNVDSLVLKMPLDELVTPGGLVNTTFWTRTGTLGPGGNYRFAQGSTHTMLMGANIDSTTFRTFQNPDGSDTITFQDHTIAAWNSTAAVSILPNGTNWADRATPFVKTGYARDDEYGFLWNSGEQPNRPQPYVRIVRFRTADHTLIGEEDLWSQTHAFLYPAAVTNAVGDIGCVLAAGGPALNPVAVALIVDDCRTSFSGAPIFGFSFGSHSPIYEGWGDYFSMQRHPARTLSFVSSGMAQQGGSQESAQEPRFLHYGRERDELSWTSVIIKSGGVSAVPISVVPVDQLGKSGVSTPGYASYLPASGYTLTAPLLHMAGGKTYRFQHWRSRPTPIVAWTTHPAGQLTLSASAIGPHDDTAQAVYREHVTGSSLSYGRGCLGSNGLVPVHSATPIPEIGRAVSYDVRDVFGTAVGTLFLGFSKTTWNGTPLPLSLGFIGSNPTCQVLAPGAVTFPVSIGPQGTASVGLSFPNNQALLGLQLDTQYLVIDPNVSWPGKLIATNGLDSTIGGLR